MDDFLGLAQGHPKLRERVRSMLFHAIDSVFRPLSPDDPPLRRDPISHSKLDKGDAKWATRKILLGWIIDTVAGTIELPERRASRLQDLLLDLVKRKRISLRKWQQSLGEIQSMVLALPSGRGLFSSLYTGFSQPSATSANRIRLSRPIHDALLDLQHLSATLSSRPTRFAEVLDTPPVAYGTADACAQGMGGIWFSASPTSSPVVWRSPFLPDIQQALISDQNPTGSITNSDLELAAQIAHQDILLHYFECREKTISTFTDNVSTRAWHRKGSTTTLGPAAYLLRVLSLHQRFYRYRASIDFVPGKRNSMADDASCLWTLSDPALLAHFNSRYPQEKPWQLLTLRPAMLSTLITSLHCKRSKPASFLHAPNLVQIHGPSGVPFAAPSPWTPCSSVYPIHFTSSKSLPTGTELASLRPITSPSELAQWRQPSAPLARPWPAWGPWTLV
jgi:hypothetical protein